jgi:hypothetical protein
MATSKLHLAASLAWLPPLGWSWEPQAACQSLGLSYWVGADDMPAGSTVMLRDRREKLNDWMPVLVVGLVVVCVTAFLLLEQKFRQPKREGQKSNRTRRPF